MNYKNLKNVALKLKEIGEEVNRNLGSGFIETIYKMQ